MLKQAFKKNDNRGVSLMELIVAVAIMVVLMSVIAPTMYRYVGKARQVRVEKETSEFIRGAQIAYIDVCSSGKAPLEDSVKNKTSKTSPFYRNGTKYGNLTNWTVKNGTVKGASNGPFAEAFFNVMGIAYGQGKWNLGKSTIPISANEPKLNPAGSMDEGCIFQIFYTSDGDMIVEYSRYGYFVRMENSMLVESVKIKNTSEKHFTTWQ